MEQRTCLVLIPFSERPPMESGWYLVETDQPDPLEIYRKLFYNEEGWWWNGLGIYAYDGKILGWFEPRKKTIVLTAVEIDSILVTVNNLLSLAKDGKKLHENHAVHQEFLDEDLATITDGFHLLNKLYPFAPGGIP